MAGKLDDKVCVITGGSLGIGSGTAKECAREGGRVAILDIHVEGGESTVAAIKEVGGISYFHRDGRVPGRRGGGCSKKCRRRIREDRRAGECGGAPGPGSRPARGDGVEEWDTVMAINLKGPFLCCKYVIPEMLKRGRRCDSERFFVSRIAGERIFVCRTQ